MANRTRVFRNVGPINLESTREGSSINGAVPLLLSNQGRTPQGFATRSKNRELATQRQRCLAIALCDWKVQGTSCWFERLRLIAVCPLRGQRDATSRHLRLFYTRTPLTSKIACVKRVRSNGLPFFSPLQIGCKPSPCLEQSQSLFFSDDKRGCLCRFPNRGYNSVHQPSILSSSEKRR